MKVIPFKKHDVHYKVNLRADIKLDVVPYTWHSNLSDHQLRNIYSRLLRERFFLRRPEIEIEKRQDTAVGVQFLARMRETLFEYEDGACQVIVFNKDVWVIYRTSDQWEAWAKAQERQIEAKRRIEEHKASLRSKHLESCKKGEVLISSGHLEEAEKCLLECHQLFSEHPDLIWHSDAKFLLIKLYGLSGDLSKGLAFLSKYGSSSYDYYLLAERFSADPHKAEVIFGEAIGRFPDDGFIYKRFCLYLENGQLFDEAIYYCSEAIRKGLADDTKAGFSGRLLRLKKRKSKFTETESE